MDRNIQQLLIIIYNEIFTKMNQSYIDVFLCGGVSSNNNRSVRDRVRDHMKRYKNIRILYPEYMFNEILNMDKDADLLTLEKFLADNCDIVCIICESPGSLVELGAFTNNEETFNKVVAVLDEKRKKDKSFIMLGPIKLIKKRNRNNVIYYSSTEIDSLGEKLWKHFRKLHKGKIIKNQNINSIIGLYYFIPLLLYFFNRLETSEIKECLKFLFSYTKSDFTQLDTLFRSSLKLLYKEKYIRTSRLEKELCYSLTDKGYDYVNSIFNSINIYNRTKLFDSIGLRVMAIKYYSNTATLR